LGFEWPSYFGAVATTFFTRFALRRMMLETGSPNQPSIWKRLGLPLSPSGSALVILTFVAFAYEYLIVSNAPSAAGPPIAESLSAIAPILNPSAIMLGLKIKPRDTPSVFPIAFLLAFLYVLMALNGVVDQISATYFGIKIELLAAVGLICDFCIFAGLGAAIRLVAEGSPEEIRASVRFLGFPFVPVALTFFDYFARWRDRRAAEARLAEARASVLQRPMSDDVGVLEGELAALNKIPSPSVADLLRKAELDAQIERRKAQIAAIDSKPVYDAKPVPPPTSKPSPPP
jgi:hypothetical protein